MVELEGLEPSKPGEKEGQEETTTEVMDTGVGIHSQQESWVWHAGGITQSDGTVTTAKWYKTDEYKKLIAPMAVQFAKTNGWRIANYWHEALEYREKGPGQEISQAEKEFFSSRKFAEGYSQKLLDFGKNIIQQHNASLYYQATGAITPIYDLEINIFYGIGALKSVGNLIKGGFKSSLKYTSSFSLETTQSIKNIWGMSAEEVSAHFEQLGYKTTILKSTRGSELATKVTIEGHPQITQILIHPGGGRHVGAYYKISTTTQGKIKVVDPETYVPTPNDKAKIINK